MYCLGIETSCDETAVAILEANENSAPKIIGELIASQSKIHEIYGGVVPELASREHLANLPLLTESLLKETSLKLSDIGCISVTQGPGLKGCLLIGINFAKGLACGLGIPVVGVNHIEGHILSAELDNTDLKPPYLALVVSGGHTEILRVNSFANYQLIARTMDDAAGEAFDKAANLLGLAYPGGPRLAALADKTSSSRFKLPKVMREAEGFSFSGLKTAILQLVQKNKLSLSENEQILGELAFTIQDSIVDTLCFKLKKAIEQSGLKTVTVSGGVSANKELRKRIENMQGVKSYFASKDHCMDNAAMIAYVGLKRFEKGERLSSQSEVKARWPVDTMD